jgi:ribose transport system ATP-binding protein
LVGLSKAFGGSPALDDVSLTIAPGEVHGLLGENGSGKSTLIKILAGFHAPDSGELRVGGEEISLPLAPGQFRALGLSFVHQDLGLIPDIAVVENLRLADLVARRGGTIWWRREEAAALATLQRYRVSHIDPRALVGDLPESDRALVAIIRALEEIREARERSVNRSGLLILDEPTVFLPRTETEALFRRIREMVDESATSVMFVSHDLDECLDITDRITVLRDGRVAGTVTTADTTEGELIELIIGRQLTVSDDEAHVPAEQVAFEVRGLQGREVAGVDITIHRGEVLGLTGLAGSGFAAVVYLLFGAGGCKEGTLEFGDVRIDLSTLTPARAITHGLALIPGDRQADGGVGELTVLENVMLPVLDEYAFAGTLRHAQLRRAAQQQLELLDVRPRNSAAEYASLSGGNQQKAVLAKWLQAKPQLVLMHEPTQGVDIGARAQIFAILDRTAKAGTAIVCASTDYEQLAAVCDRVLIFARGAIVSELRGSGVTKDRIAERVWTMTATASGRGEHVRAQ